MKPIKNSISGKEAQGLVRSNPPWQVALIGNLKDKFIRGLFDPPDAGAEFDRKETFEAITQALESEGHWVIFLDADQNLPRELAHLRPDICFNIAEGLQGDGREAQVPALCELMGMPYTGSRVVANAVSLDKTQTKRIWRDLGLPVAPFKECYSNCDLEGLNLRFPLFVKPSREGTGMGIDSGAMVHTRAELRTRVEWVLRTYRQPALVEEYLPGREFTVGYIGNPGNPSKRYRPSLYDQGGYHWLPVLEIDSNRSLSPGVYGHDAKDRDIGESGAPEYLCPADIPQELRARLVELTKQAAEALGACDASRVDLRMGADGEPYLMEINTLPGLNPMISDLCIMASSEGMPYSTLITEILYLAAERYGFPLAPASITLPKGDLLLEKVKVPNTRRPAPGSAG